MKSFSQFLQESYLSEEIPGNISRDEFNKLPARSKRNLTGGSDVGLGLQDQPLQKPKFPNYGGSSRPAVRSARTRSNASPESWGHRNPGKLPIPNPPSRPQGTTTTVPSSSITGQSTKALPPGKSGGTLAKPIDQIPDSMAQGAYDAARRNPRTGTSSNPTATPSTPPSSTPQRRPPTANTTPQRRPPSANPSSRIEVVGKPPSGSPPRSPGGALALRSQGSSALTAPTGSRSNPINIRTNLNVPGRPRISGLKSGGALRKLGKLAGPLGVAADVGLETIDQKSRGRKTGSALAMGATKAAGGLVGAKAGAATGAAIGSLAGPIGTAVGAGIGGVGGYLAGSGIAGKASETVAGATGKEKAAMATANRQRQAGSAIKGIGGSTSFSQRKPGGPTFMSTGVGSQRKTVQLANTGVVNRGGQSVAGYLAIKNGQRVYKAGPSAQSLAKTSSNPFERVGRSLFAGAYKKHDAAKAQQALQRATRSDMERSKKLGVKYKPGG
jgi:hypothetical protein